MLLVETGRRFVALPHFGLRLPEKPAEQENCCDGENDFEQCQPRDVMRVAAVPVSSCVSFFDGFPRHVFRCRRWFRASRSSEVSLEVVLLCWDALVCPAETLLDLDGPAAALAVVRRSR